MEKFDEFRVLHWPCAWVSECGVGHDAEASAAVVKSKKNNIGSSLNASVARFRIPQPDDLVYDPRYGVKVSRFGQDKGAMRRDVVKGLATDPHDPLKDIEVVRVRSGLLRMKTDGTIDEQMFLVGMYFQKHYEIAGYCPYTASSFSDNPGGETGPENQMDRTAHSRAVVGKFMSALGYPDTQASKAAWWVLGQGIGLDEIAKSKDKHGYKGCGDKAYWRALVVAALQTMLTIYDPSRKIISKAKTSGQRYFTDDQLGTPEGVSEYVVDTARR